MGECSTLQTVGDWFLYSLVVGVVVIEAIKFWRWLREADNG